MTAAAQLAICGRPAEVDAVVVALTEGRPVEVLFVRPRRALDTATVVVHLDVRVEDEVGRAA